MDYRTAAMRVGLAAACPIGGLDGATPTVGEKDRPFLKRVRGGALVVAGAAMVYLFMGAKPVEAALPPGNTVEQWNQIAENTVVGAGAFQNEGLIYMAYESAAVYNATVAIRGGYTPYGAGVHAPKGSSADAAVIEAAYDTLVHYFPLQSASLYASYTEALAAISEYFRVGGPGAGGTALPPDPDSARWCLALYDTPMRKPEGFSITTSPFRSCR